MSADVDGFLERLEAQLRDAGYLRGEVEDISQLLEAVGDLIEEREHIGRDHFRMECLSNLVEEAASVTLTELTDKTIRVSVKKVHGARPYYDGESLAEALDKAHKGEHE